MNKPLIPTETANTGVLSRIAVQVGHLIRPDLSALPMELRARIAANERQRIALMQRADELRNEAYGAATRLMMNSDEHWEPIPRSYFERVRQIEGRVRR